MKTRWLIIVVVAIAILLALLAGLFLFTQPQSQTKPIQPTANPFAAAIAPNQDLPTFVANCFKTYTKYYIASGNASVDSPALNQFAQTCFTKDFIAQWPTIASNSDSDPVLISQDYYNSWLTTANVSIATQTSSGATAIVNLGSGAETLQLIAQLERTSDGWRIASVSLASTTSQ